MSTVANITTYPIKGLPGRDHASIAVRRGAPLPGDRRWGLKLDRAPLDPTASGWASKRNFAQGVNSPKTLIQSVSWDGEDALTLNGQGLSLPEDGETLCSTIEAVMRNEALTLYGPTDWLTDQDRPRISLLNLASLEDLSAKAGQTLQIQRFRGNLLVAGVEALAERDWVGAQVRIGGATFDVVEPIERCEATAVNLLTGERDIKMLDSLERHYGHRDFGVFLEVADGGTVHVGDGLHHP